MFIPQPGIDQDASGAMDFITIDILRPSEGSSTKKMPAIIDPSPYYTTVCRGNESQCMADWDGDNVNAARCTAAPATSPARSRSSTSSTAACPAKPPPTSRRPRKVASTLSLTLGTPASFGAFTPGITRTYEASTTANVISSAGREWCAAGASAFDGGLTAPDPARTPTSVVECPPAVVAPARP